MKLSEATYFPDAKELTRHGFVSHMEDFIGKLLGDNPLGADVDDYLKGFDIDAPKALKMLMTPEIADDPNSAVIIRSEKIKNGGVDGDGKPMKDEFQVIYKVPKRNPEMGIKGIDEKLRNLYIKTFENHEIKGTILNEDGEGGAMGGDFGFQDGGPGAAACNDSAPIMPGFYDKSGKETIITKGFYTGPTKKKKETDESKKMKLPIGRKTMYITEEQFRKLKEAVEMDTKFGDFGYDAPGLGIKKDDEAMNHSDLLTRKKNKAVGHKSLEEGESGIHINPENKGKFTATKKRTGKTTSELLNSPNEKTRARANFARMAKRGWKPLKKDE